MAVLRLSEVDEIHSEVGQQLVGWLSQYRFFSAKRVEVVKNGEDEFKLRLYTTNNVYSIVAHGNRPGWRDYLGCMVKNRRARPGEGWVRGSDLPDGRFSREVWLDILGSMVFYEAREVVKPRKAVVVPAVVPPQVGVFPEEPLIE